MAYPQQVKTYAKGLYLTASNKGDHKHSLQGIVEEIQQEFNEIQKYPDKSTVYTWVHAKDKETKKSWNDLWEIGVRHGISNAVLENENGFDEEEQIEIQVDKIIGLRAGNAIKAAQKIQRKLDSNQDLSKDDLKLWRESERTFNNLNLENKGGGVDPIEIDYDYLDEVNDDDEDVDEAE